MGRPDLNRAPHIRRRGKQTEADAVNQFMLYRGKKQLFLLRGLWTHTQHFRPRRAPAAVPSALLARFSAPNELVVHEECDA